ncbi:Glutathione S-transferase 2 [Steccherinum ochraceum]|uniref:Glutathione S-transferase 2 n=1 Tax=Steccherinum ochraceum TaxID=92696 RepID=A0A4R0RKU8_9APHY|nr:Glutathione S-transferase 2 [Steccherinum ochraceum]
MSHGKQFTLYSALVGVNAWKVVIVLEDLGLTYETVNLDLRKKEQKLPAYTSINPNGQVPALIDHHNRDFTVWDSCACMTYLVEKYDTEHKLSVESLEERMSMLQWMHFQNCCQGTMLVELFCFAFVMPEKSTLALKRYHGEIIRAYSVLESALKGLKENDGSDWLVGGKVTIADLGFVIWTHMTPFLMSTYEGRFNLHEDYPFVSAWHRRMAEIPVVKKVLDSYDQANRGLSSRLKQQNARAS